MRCIPYPGAHKLQICSIYICLLLICTFIYAPSGLCRLAGMGDEGCGELRKLQLRPDAAAISGHRQSPLSSGHCSLSLGRATPSHHLPEREPDDFPRLDPGQRVPPMFPPRRSAAASVPNATVLHELVNAPSDVPASAGTLSFGSLSGHSLHGSMRGLRFGRLDYVTVRDPPPEPVPDSLSDGTPLEPWCVSGFMLPKPCWSAPYPAEATPDSSTAGGSSRVGAQVSAGAAADAGCCGGNAPCSTCSPHGRPCPTESTVDTSAEGGVGVREVADPVRDGGWPEDSPEAASPAGGLSARYSKAQLKATLQLMGCKARHAHKASTIFNTCLEPAHTFSTLLRLMVPLHRSSDPIMDRN